LLKYFYHIIVNLMSIFKDNYLHEIPPDIQKHIMELSQYYVLDNLLVKFGICMTEYISTREILEKQQQQQDHIFDLSSSINNRSKIITKLKKIGLCEKKEEINKFLQDHINKYGKDITYNIMKNKIDEKYNFYKTYILYRNY
jgi:hypothetical protein